MDLQTVIKVFSSTIFKNNKMFEKQNFNRFLNMQKTRFLLKYDLKIAYSKKNNVPGNPNTSLLSYFEKCSKYF